MIFVGWKIGEGIGIVGLIILPILIIYTANSFSMEEAKTKTIYVLSSLTLTLYILITLGFRISEYSGFHSLIIIVYHFVAVLSNIVILIGNIKVKK